MDKVKMKTFKTETVSDRTELCILNDEINKLSKEHNEIYRKLRELGVARDRIQQELAKKCILINGKHSRKRHQIPYGHNEHDYVPCVYCGWDH